MKKSIDFKLGGRDSEMFFRPIRKKEDYLNLLFNSMKLMYVAEPSGSATISPSMQLCVDKSSRLLFSSQDKIFSVSFPFLVELGDTHKIKFYSSTYGEITSVTISDTLSLLNSDSFRNSSDIEDLDAALCELVSYSRPGYWSFLKELFFSKVDIFGLIMIQFMPMDIYTRYFISMFFTPLGRHLR